MTSLGKPLKMKKMLSAQVAIYFINLKHKLWALRIDETYPSFPLDENIYVP